MAIVRDISVISLEKGYARINYRRINQHSGRKGAGYAVSKLIKLGCWGWISKPYYKPCSKVPFTLIEPC